MKVACVLALASFAVCALFTKSHAVSWNDQSRFATAEALSRSGTFAIENTAFGALTRDRYAYRGHLYSDKAPLPAIQAAAVAVLLRAVHLPLTPLDGTAIYLVTLFTVGVWFVLGVVYVFSLQRLLGFGEKIAVLVAGMAAVATLALPYATVLVNHVPAAAAALACIYHAVRARWGSLTHAAAAGTFGAVAVAFDPAAAVVFAGAAVLLARFALPAAVAAGAALALLAAQASFNVAVSGSVVPPVFNAELWAGSPFASRYSTDPFWHASATQIVQRTAGAIAGEKGFLPYMPLTLGCLAGFFVMLRHRGLPRTLACACLITVALYFVLLVWYHETGSVNFGERRYADIAFVLCAGLGYALTSARGIWSSALCVLAIVSIAVSALGALAPFAPHSGDSSLVYAAGEYARLAHRAPAAAALDLCAFLAVSAAMLRYWPRGGEPSPVTEPPGIGSTLLEER